MNDLRSSEQTISNGGTGYRFNAEGNQISYRCDVRRVTTINYDRKVIRSALGKLNQQADETSAKIDLCIVTSKVDYVPPFTDISICKASKRTCWLRDQSRSNSDSSVRKAERVTYHAAGNADGANGGSGIGRLPYPK